MHSNVRLYVFSTVMRSPRMSSGGVEPGYFETYAPSLFQMSALLDKRELQPLTNNEKRALRELQGRIPPDVLEDWSERRNVNFRLNLKLIADLKSGLIDSLVIGRDDTAPYSQSNREARQLDKAAAGLPLGSYASFPGADQFGMLLLTRAINELDFRIPIVKVNYAPGAGPGTVPSYEDKAVGDTVFNHIIAAGGIPLPNPLKPDLVLAVNTPENGRTLEAGTPANQLRTSLSAAVFIRKIERDLTAGRRVAVADISFANGADNTLMHGLAGKGLLPKLDAYSGWNTAGNTIGYAVGQGLLATHMNAADKNNLLTVRLLDDWAYQANVRSQVASEVLRPLHGNYFYLEWLRPYITYETERRIAQFAERNFRDLAPQQIRVVFPWNRLFEIKVEAK